MLLFHFVLIVNLLVLSLVLTSGFSHVGNSRTDGPRGTSLTGMMSQSNNSQLPRVLVLLPFQVCTLQLVCSRPCAYWPAGTWLSPQCAQRAKWIFLTTWATWKWLREVPCEDSTPPLGRRMLWVRLTQSTHLTVNSAPLIAVNNRINAHYCWQLPFHFSTGSKGWEMLLQTDQCNHIPQHTECLFLGSKEWNTRDYIVLHCWNNFAR